MKKPILSTFQGIGMLDSGFVQIGYCVVSSPERILNGDIRDFHSVPNIFEGVIGGSPCQSFSGLNRNPNGESLELLYEFCRVVQESDCNWFLHENVVRVPKIEIKGYHVQRFNLCPTQLGFSQSRNRTFQFGSKKGLILALPEPVKRPKLVERIVLASEGKKTDRRTFEDFCKLQGFDLVPQLESFTVSAKYRAVGNGVHLEVSHFLAKAIMEATSNPNPKTIFNSKLCLCGCGRVPDGNKENYNGACRKRRFSKRCYESGVSKLRRETVA